MPICEDIWKEEVCECLAECGAEILISPNGSPFDWPKPDKRMNVAVARVTETKLPLVYLNQVGGQDELVFDGASFVLNGDHSLAAQLPAWEEAVVLTEWTKADGQWRCVKGPIAKLEDGDAEAYHACVLGLRDYVGKNGFPGVVLGLSGGINSALVAAIAVDALGPERVHCVMLPYRYTSNASLDDAAQCAKALGVRYDIVPIAAGVEGFEASLAAAVQGQAGGHDGREYPEPHARRDADGHLEQARRHGADDRQQERDVGRLRHALRRHERRLQSDQGSLQDGGLPPVALAQCACAEGRQGPQGRSDPEQYPDQGADRGAASQSDGSGFVCRPTRCWTISLRAWSRTR